MCKTTILVCPRLNLPGGVANFYSMLSPYLKNDIDLFQYHSASCKGKFAKACASFFDFLSFFLKCFKYKKVYLNPSLGCGAVFRDGLYYILAHTVFRKKTIVFWHGWNFAEVDHLKKNHLLLFWFRNTLLHADLSFCLSQAIKTDLQKLGVFGPVRIMTTAFENSLAEDSAKPVPITEKKGFTCLFLARLEEDKGIFFALDVFHDILKKHPDVHLVIAGCGSAEKAVFKKIEEQGICNVDYLGYVTGMQKKETMLHADCYLLPSFHAEGMPCSVLEAMAMGLPVIVTPVGGIPDFFENGKMGWMLPLEKKAEWISHIEALILNRKKREEINVYNRQYAIEHFAASKVAKNILKEIATI